KRADGKIAQPKVGEAASLPDAKERPVDGQAQCVVAAFDRDPDTFAEVAAFNKWPAGEDATTLGTRAIEPERQCKAVAEQEIHFAPPQRIARRFRIGKGTHVRLGKERAYVLLMGRACHDGDLLALDYLRRDGVNRDIAADNEAGGW